MARLSYDEQVDNLNKAINIAIKAIQENPPKGFDESQISHIVNTYLEFKNDILNPKPEFKNVKSLKYIENDAFTYFQEGSGDAVNIFWKNIKESDLPYKRVNKISKILKRNKIKNQVEYDFILDVLLPYKEAGLINKDEENKINQMIKDFEEK